MTKNDPYREFYQYEDKLERSITNNSIGVANQRIGDNKVESPLIEPTTIIAPRAKKKISLAKMTSLIAATTVVAATAVAFTGGVSVKTVTTDYFYGGANITMEVTDFDETDFNQGYVIAVDDNGEAIYYPAYCDYQPATDNQDDEEVKPILSTWYATLEGLSPGANYNYDIYHLSDMPTADFVDDFSQYLADQNNATKIYSSTLTLDITYSVIYTYSFEPNLLYNGSMTLHYDCILLAPNGDEIVDETTEIDALTLTIGGDKPQTVQLPRCSTSGTVTVAQAPTRFDISFTDDGKVCEIYSNESVEYTYAEAVPTSTVVLDTAEQNIVNVSVSTGNIDFDLSSPTHLVALVVNSVAVDVGGVEHIEAITAAFTEYSFTDLSDELSYNFEVYAVKHSPEQSQYLTNALRSRQLDLSGWTKIGGTSVESLPRRAPTGSFELDTSVVNTLSVSTVVNDITYGGTDDYLSVLVVEAFGEPYDMRLVQEGQDTLVFDDLSDSFAYNIYLFTVPYSDVIRTSIENGDYCDYSQWTQLDAFYEFELPTRIPEIHITESQLVANLIDAEHMYVWSFMPDFGYYNPSENVLAVRAVSEGETSLWVRIENCESYVEIPLASNSDYQLEFCYYPEPSIEEFDLQSVTDYSVSQLVYGEKTIKTPDPYEFIFVDFQDYAAKGTTTQSASLLWSMSIIDHSNPDATVNLDTIPAGMTIYALTRNTYNSQERIDITYINGYINTGAIAMPDVTKEQNSVTVWPEIYVEIDGITIKAAVSPHPTTIMCNFIPTATVSLEQTSLSLTATVNTNAIFDEWTSHAVVVVLYTDSGSGMVATEVNTMNYSSETYTFTAESPLPCEIKVFAIPYTDESRIDFIYADVDYDFSQSWLLTTQNGMFEVIE